MATRSNILAWTVPWPEKPGGLLSMGSQSRTQLEHAHICLMAAIQITVTRCVCGLFVPGASQAAASSLSVWTPCRTWTTTVPTAKLSWAPTSVCRTRPDLKGAMCCRKASPTLHPAPLLLVKALPWWSRVSRGSTFVSSFGGENIAKITHLQTPEMTARSRAQTCKDILLECWVQGFLSPSSL